MQIRDTGRDRIYTHTLALILMYINMHINISHDPSDDVCYKRNKACVRGE